MNKFQEFKEIASNVGVVLKKYWFFRQNRDKYLAQTTITEKEVDSIIENLNVGFNWEVKDESEQAFRDDTQTLFNKILLVDSFYNNHQLFKNLYSKLKLDNLRYEFQVKIFVKTLNQRTTPIDIEETIKNINFINNKEINLLVLEKSIISSNEKLYNFIMPLFDFKQDEKEILHIMFSTISKYGDKIKDKKLLPELKKYIKKENVAQLVSGLYSFEEKNKKNINEFLNIDIIKELAGNNDNLNKFNLNTVTHSHKQMKEFLNNINKEQDYTKIILNYIISGYNKVDIVEKFKVLNSKNLLNEQVWDRLIKKENKQFLEIIFDNYSKIDIIIGRDKVERVIRTYREIVLNNYVDDIRYEKFINNYPGVLNDEDLLNIINKRIQIFSFNSDFEKEAINIVNSKYPGQLTLSEEIGEDNEQHKQMCIKKEKQWIDLLYKKYPQYMQKQETLLSIVKICINDMFLSTYLKRYYDESKLNQQENEQSKRETLKHIRIFSGYSYPQTLEWIIDNNLLKDLIPNYGDLPMNLFTRNVSNQWTPLLIEKYNVKPDAIIKNTVASFMSNDELFKFILTNYELEPRTQQQLCNSVYSIDATELATEMLKKGIVINDYFEEKFRNSPTQAGNILLKAKLKEKLENRFDEMELNKPKVKVKKI